MGISANQARFLSLTSRQIDLEKRIQDICQRRMRLSTQLENISTAYNNAISNRKMYTASNTNGGIQDLSISNLNKLGYQIVDNETNNIVGESLLIKQVLPVSSVSGGEIAITSAAQLQQALNTNPAGHYVLMNDIDLSSLGTLNTSLVTNTFTGTLDGNGYTIENLNINETSAKSTSTAVHTGLFSTLGAGASVSNLVLKDFDVKSTDTANPSEQETSRSNTTGTLAGYVNGATIDNVTTVDSTVSSDHAAGGLIGVMGTGSVTNCSTAGTVQGGCFTGGMIGQILGGKLDICNSSATVNGGNYTGGLIGESLAGSNPVISRSYATGNVSGVQRVGGLIGRNHNAILQDCYSTGNVSGSYCVGGICGDTMDNSTIINSYSAGSVIGGTLVGGLVGATNNVGSISNSFWMDSSQSAVGSGAVTITNAQNVADYSALSAAAKAAGWGNNPNEFAETPLTGSGGSWDTSSTPPKLYAPAGYSWTPEKIEENLRSGRFSLITPADEFTQTPLDIGNKEYEKVDWRTVPIVDDELYGADDADAENQYDKATDEINAQDKKLQLEDESIEVEYKEVTSEKEAVKKILDTNSQASFKYFG